MFDGGHTGVTFTYNDTTGKLTAAVDANPAFTTSITFEGATADAYETTLQVTDPTADRTITLPDATGTVALTSDITVTASSTNTFTNKSIALGTNTLTGTKAEFDTALTDGTFVDTTSTQTLENKTLSGSQYLRNIVDVTDNSTLKVKGGNYGVEIQSATDGSTFKTWSFGTDGVLSAPGNIVFEGATADAYETTLAITDPTADRTITLPNASGTVALTSDLASAYTDEMAQDAIGNALGTGLSYNDTTGAISVTANTYDAYGAAGTAQSNAESTASGYVSTHAGLTSTHGVSGAIVGTTDTQTLSSKTLTSPVVSGLTISDASIVLEGTTADAFETTLTVGDPTADRTVTFPDATGTVALTNNKLSAFAATSSSELAGVISDETGTGALVFANTPTLVTPNIGAATGTSLVLSGDLTVNGTTTTINSTEITVDDKNLTLGAVATPTDAGADGGGITLKGATDKTLNWVDATDAWTSSENFNIASGKSYYVNGTALKDVSETLTNKTITSPTVSGLTLSDGSIVIEGSTADAFETTLTVTDPTADRTITFQDASGTVAFTSDITVSASSTNTFTNKSIALGTNTVTGTLAQFNTAVTDADFVSLAGTETLTNKTLTSPTLTTPAIGAATGASLELTGSITLADALIGTATQAITSGSATVVDSWAVASYSSAKYIVQMKNGNDIEVLEVLVTVDGNNNVYLTEYADVISNTELGTTDADYLSGNVRLKVTSSNGTTVKVHKTLIEA
jgi:hypothetical protein